MLDSCGLQRLDDHVSYSHPCHGFHPEVRAQQGQRGSSSAARMKTPKALRLSIGTPSTGKLGPEHRHAGNAEPNLAAHPLQSAPAGGRFAELMARRPTSEQPPQSPLCSPRVAIRSRRDPLQAPSGRLQLLGRRGAPQTPAACAQQVATKVLTRPVVQERSWPAPGGVAPKPAPKVRTHPPQAPTIC
jgi:hypothetical protein